MQPLRTFNGAAVNGFLYTRGRSDAVLCIMHPREFLATGSDLRLEHEVALLDVAFLRDAGFRRVVLVGNSGGASLYGFHNEQSLLAATDRLDHTPGGRGVPLREADMPAVDGMVFVAPHPGQGIVPPSRPPASSGSGSAAATTGRRWRRENRRGGSLRALRSGTGWGSTLAEARLAAGCAGRLACRSGLP